MNPRGNAWQSTIMDSFLFYLFIYYIYFILFYLFFFGGWGGGAVGFWGDWCVFQRFGTFSVVLRVDTLSASFYLLVSCLPVDAKKKSKQIYIFQR
jgi:hypothetical protein